MNGRNTVVVVGGGYGGVAVAKSLDAEADVILIDPKDAFVHSAGSLRALVRPDWAGNIFFPYDTLLEHGRVLRDKVTAVDPAGVTLASGERVAADYLVLATGSGYPFPAKPDTDVAAEALDRFRAAHGELARAEHVLLFGGGPVGIELAGEIKAEWPGKRVTIVDPGTELLPGLLPEVRADLLGQLAELGVTLRLGTAPEAEPDTEPGKYQPFGVRHAGEEIKADIWFRCFGVRTQGDYLADGAIAVRNAAGQVPVTSRLTVAGHDRVFAVGDLTDLPEAKMAGHAMRHADVVAANIKSLLRGEEPTAEYHAPATRFQLVPLGPLGGVGQIPGDDGAPMGLPAQAVSDYKGKDLMVGHFAGMFGKTV